MLKFRIVGRFGVSFPGKIGGNLAELRVVFAKTYRCSLTKTKY